MKNIFILLISLQFSLVCYSQHHTRDYITLVASNRDTAGTIFGHIFWYADTKILFHLPPEDSFYNPRYPDISLELEHLYYDSMYVMLRFPGKNWAEPVNNFELSYADYEARFSTTGKSDLLTDPYGTKQIHLRLDLLDLFDSYPEIFEELKTGTLLEIQAKMGIQADSFPHEWIYSNIDTIYLPPATPDDIAGFYYLKSNNVDICRLSRLRSGTKLSLLQWEYIRDNFKNSIISEYAEYYAFISYIHKIYPQRTSSNSEEIKQLYVTLLKKLRNSKSEILADEVKGFLKTSNITD